MFRLGWQVLWTRIGAVVDVERVRRAAVIAAAVTLVAVVVSVVLQLRSAWAGSSPLGAGVAIALTTVGVGLLLFSCFPTARPLEPAATINGRQVRPDALLTVRWSVEPYLVHRPKPITPDDRAAVLDDVHLLQRGLIGRLSRFGPMTLGLALLGLGFGVATEFRSVAFLSVLLYVGLIPDLVVRLGRSERARLAALATEPPPPGSEQPQWRRDPSGSKLGLPGE
ncbi:hypothetical protein ACRQ4B_05595 [Curtobacterium sp. SP.BCo]|uniref:hypothetical protein n=1 Tax=Curtobacterium sp. SP.BCo TaxID=3435229 RepID=UPI003F73AF3A